MRDRTKIWLSIATFFVGAGLILFVVVMTMNNWNFKNLNTLKYTTDTHTIEEAFQNIELNTEAADIRLEQALDGKCRVECSVPESWKHSAEVTEGTLRITLKDDTRWYDHIGINVKSPKITVYLPEENYKLLTANMTSGALDVPKNFHFIGIEIETKSADVECEASATGTIKITTSSGDVNLNELSASAITVTTSSGHVTAEATTAGSLTVITESGDPRLHSVYCNTDLKVDVNSGDAHLSDISCQSLFSTGESGKLTVETANVYDMLLIKRQSGDVTLKRCDIMNSISITTTSGDVNGNFDRSVLCHADSKSGDIKIPRNSFGVYCEINTDSGDIKITDYEVPAAPVTQAIERSNNITLFDNPESNSQYLALNSFVLYRNKEKYSDAHLVVAVKRNIPVSEIPSDRIIGGLGFDSDDLHEDFTVRRKDYPLLDEDISIVFDFDDIFAAADSLGAKKLQVIIDGNAGFSLTGIYLVYEE